MKVTKLILYSSTYCWHVMACGVESEDLERVMREQQPRFLDHYVRLCDEHRFKIPSFGIKLDEEAISTKIFNFQLPFDAPPITIEEVADRLYWDEGLESFGLPARLGQSRINLFKSLYEIAFKPSDLTFDELRALLVLEGEKDAAEFEFGRASTYPLIADFIRAISSNPAYDMISIKENLAAHFEDVSRALTRGRSYDIIAMPLQWEACVWILDYSLLIKDNVEVSKILCKTCGLYGVARSPALYQRFLDVSDQIKDFFVPLSRLPEHAATEKLFLMVGIPQYATYIYEHTTAEALRFIFWENLTTWRAEVANSLRWEEIQMTRDLLLIFLDYQKDYYDGYLANSRFDELVYSLGHNRLLELFNGEDPETFAESLKKYKRRAVMEERLGTVYSILQEEHGLAGPINPLSEEVDNNFEKQIITGLGGKYGSWSFWLGQKYLQSVNVLASRLAFHPRYDNNGYLQDSFQEDKTKFINTIQDVHSSIAKICSLPGDSTLSVRIEEQSPPNYYQLSIMVLGNLVKNCVPEVCIPSILNYLDGGEDEDLVTSKLLLNLLRNVAWKHFPETKYIRFNCFSEGLKNKLLSLLKR